jgi:hypothetical protein
MGNGVLALEIDILTLLAGVLWSCGIIFKERGE